MQVTDLNAGNGCQGYKITFRLLFTYYDFNSANNHCLIRCCLQACHVLPFLGKIFIISIV